VCHLHHHLLLFFVLQVVFGVWVVFGSAVGKTEDDEVDKVSTCHFYLPLYGVQSRIVGGERAT